MSTYSTPAHPTTTAPHANYGAILKGHHKAVKAHDGNTYHVFAIGGSPPFGDNGRQYDFNVAFSLGPISLGLQGSIDLATDFMQAELYATIPIYGRINLAPVNGDLKTGITVSFSADNIISGTAKFYLNGTTVDVDISATVFGNTIGPVTLALFQIPPQ